MATFFPGSTEEPEFVAVAIRTVTALVVQVHSLDTCLEERLQLLMLGDPVVVQVSPYAQGAEGRIGGIDAAISVAACLPGVEFGESHVTVGSSGAVGETGRVTEQLAAIVNRVIA